MKKQLTLSSMNHELAQVRTSKIEFLEKIEAIVNLRTILVTLFSLKTPQCC